MVKRESSPGSTTANVAKCLCSLNRVMIGIFILETNLGLIVKLPAVGFMAATYLATGTLLATYCVLWISFSVSLFLQYQWP